MKHNNFPHNKLRAQSARRTHARSAYITVVYVYKHATSREGSRISSQFIQATTATSKQRQQEWNSTGTHSRKVRRELELENFIWQDCSLGSVKS